MHPAWPISIAVALIALGWAVRWLLDNPRGDLETGLLYRAGRAYCRLVHGLRARGVEHIPTGRHPGPLIVVANHTAGVDPVLVQACCPFEIRWVMAEDMRLPAFESFWRWAGIIFVDRRANSAPALREAMRHLEEGGVIGIFPEGGIERPARTVLPFMRGIGLLIARTRAPVLPVVIEGTPQVNPAWSSLWKPSRSRVRFLAPERFDGCSAAEVATALRQRFIDATGWPANDTPGEILPGKGTPARARSA